MKAPGAPLLLAVAIGLYCCMPHGAARAAEEIGMLRTLSLDPGPGNPRNSEGDFIVLRDGRILFVYTHFTGGASDHATAYLAARVSADGGRTWSAEDTVVVPNEGGMNVMSVSLLRLQSGEIALFYLRKNSVTDCRPYLRLSTDEGATWSAPTLCIAEPGYYVVNNDRVVQLRGGRLVIPAAHHANPEGKWSSRSMAMCYLSDDNGKTWRRSETRLEAPAASGTGLQEPGVIELKDGRLMMLSRTDRGCQYRSWSSDGGVTWSPAEPTDILSPVSPATFKRIPRTGDILLAWNNHREIDAARRGKRTPFNLALSRDEGLTWERIRTIEDDPNGWYCYTAMEFVGDNVLLGYCAGNKEIGGLNRTQVALVPVEGLYR